MDGTGFVLPASLEDGLRMTIEDEFLRKVRGHTFRYERANLLICLERSRMPFRAIYPLHKSKYSKDNFIYPY